MNREIVAQTIAELLHKQVQCVLATSADKQVFLHLMAYAFSSDLAEVFVVSYNDTQKVRSMLANPGVTLLWDNRTGNIGDHVGGLALTGFGTAQPLNAEAHSLAVTALLARNNTLSALVDSDKAMTFAITVSRYRLVTGYSEVYEFAPPRSSSAPRYLA